MTLHASPARPDFVRRLFAALTSMATPAMDRLYGGRKRALFAGFHGTILEIGAGAGANMAYYPVGVRVVAVEPNPHMHGRLRERGWARRLDLRVVAGVAEHLPLRDESVDGAVATLVLCSVDDPVAVLHEIRRVLKPGAGFYFIEHVAAPEGTWLRRLQRFVRPVWAYFGDGCRPDRETADALEQAGFARLRYEPFRVGTRLSPVSPHIMGSARRDPAEPRDQTADTHSTG